MVFKRQAAPLLACLALVSCALPAISTGTAQITPVPTVIAPYRGPILAQYCADDTASSPTFLPAEYPRADFFAANRLVANSLVQSVVPNSGGLALYATAITSETTASVNTLAPFLIPPIENYPALPPTPSQSNPISYPATATAAAAQSAPAIATYNAETMSVNDEVNVVKGQVAHDGNRLTTWNPPVDHAATDIWGCLQLARHRFQGQPGTKYLIIASGMQNNTNASYTPDFTSSHALAGVIVHVIYYDGCGDDAEDCQYWINQWQGIFVASGASSIRFDDPAQSQAITNLLG